MINKDLTKDQQFVLMAFYKEYKDKKNAGLPDAKCFGSPEDFHDVVQFYYTVDYLIELCLSLHEDDGSGYLAGYRCECSIIELEITEKLIFFGENYLKNKGAKILKSLKDIKDILI